jgi:negative regulator of flagellin synthesis FlgM
MKINGPGGLGPIKAYTSQIRKDKAGSKEKAGESQADTLEISKEAMELQSFRSALDNIPEVREELVTALKQSIDEGSYQPDSDKIAAGILREKFLDSNR